MHHHIKPNQAHVVRNDLKTYRPSYRVYRPDGIWAKEVAEFSTDTQAVAFCEQNGWEVVR